MTLLSACTSATLRSAEGHRMDSARLLWITLVGVSNTEPSRHSIISKLER